MSKRTVRQFVRPVSVLAVLIVGLLTTPLTLSVTGAAAGVPSRQPPRSAAAVTAALNSAGLFRGLNPTRVLDTRRNLGAIGPVGPGRSVALQVVGDGYVPSSGASAVVINLTVTGAAGSGYLSVFPDGVNRPLVSSLNFTAGQTVANLVMVRVGADGRIQLYNGSRRSVQLVGDLAGYYLPGAPAAAGAFQPVTPVRLLDTRNGLGAAAAPLGPGHSMTLTMISGRVGAGGLPPTGASAVVINMTVTRPTGSGYLSVFPDGLNRPPVSSLNFRAGQTVANLVVVPVGADGKIRLYNGSRGTIQLVGDLAGYYLTGAPAVAGAFQPVSPIRLLDTRIGLGAAVGPLGADRSMTLTVIGTGSPANWGDSTAVLNVTVVEPTGAGWVTVYPDGSAVPNTSSVNFTVGQTVANLVTVPIGADGRIRLSYRGGGHVHLLVDAAGFYLNGHGAGQCDPIPPDPAGTAVTRWNPVVRCVLWALGQSAASVGDVDLIIEHESSGDPNAINLWDINAKEGHPSEGLIQVIRPTFDAYRSGQLPNNLYDPAANLYAGLNYAIARYGSIHNVPGLVSLRNGGPYTGYVIHG